LIYLTTEELSSRIKYDQRYIREQLKDRVFKKGTHYIQPFGRRKILFIWDAIEKIMVSKCIEDDPMALITLRRNK
jgi:hypothetical protein